MQLLLQMLAISSASSYWCNRMVFWQISARFCGVCGCFNLRLWVCWPSHWLCGKFRVSLWSADQLCFRWWRVYICKEGKKACCSKPWKWAHCSMFDNLLVNTNAVQVNSQECTAKAHDLGTHTVWFDHQTQPERSLCPGKKQPTGLCWLSCLQDLFASSDSGLFISNRTAKEAEEFFLFLLIAAILNAKTSKKERHRCIWWSWW